MTMASTPQPAADSRPDELDEPVAFFEEATGNEDPPAPIKGIG